MSKELEEAIKRFETYCLFNSEQFKKDYETIKSALERNEKLVELLKRTEIRLKYKTYEEYKVKCILERLGLQVNEDEFNFLKEILK